MHTVNIIFLQAKSHCQQCYEKPIRMIIFTFMALEMGPKVNIIKSKSVYWTVMLKPRFYHINILSIFALPVSTERLWRHEKVIWKMSRLNQKCWMPVINTCAVGAFSIGFVFDMIRHLHELVWPNSSGSVLNNRNTTTGTAKLKFVLFFPAQAHPLIWRVEITSDLYI